MTRRRRVKIVATLGPASSDPDAIGALHAAGADVFRINLSHADHDLMRTLVARIRAVEMASGRPITILADLQGPKLRIGRFVDARARIPAGTAFRFDSDPTPGDATRVNLPHPEVLSALRPGHRLLIDDGKMVFHVTDVSHDAITAVPPPDAEISDRKGVSCPDTTLPVGAITPKDRNDLDAALEAGVDWVALSFIQRPDDIAEARKIARGRAGILAKIEKPQAIARLDEIIELSDALMVARGDLGVEMPLDQVPGLQKRITRAARQAGKPVVVATQMLESMIFASTPTRAEVSDVATAVFDGADAVMLSAESAAGRYPTEAVAMMDRIGQTVEADPNYFAIVAGQRGEPEPTGADALAAAARQIAETLNVAFVAPYTVSGITALRVARERPRVPIVALCPDHAIARRLGMAWGLHAVVVPPVATLDEVIVQAGRAGVDGGFAKTGARMLIVAGVPLATPGVTNLLQIAFVRSGDER